MTVHDLPMSGYKIDGSFHTFQVLEKVSPSWDQGEWVSLKPWPEQHPEKSKISFSWGLKIELHACVSHLMNSATF